VGGEELPAEFLLKQGLRGVDRADFRGKYY